MTLTCLHTRSIAVPRLVGALVLALLLIGAAGCGGGGDTGANPASEPVLATFSPRAPRRAVVWLVVDGMRPDSLWRAAATADRGGALAEVFGVGLQHSAVCLDATTVFPSVTYAANASLVTGLSPAVHGIAGNRYLDRGSGVPMTLDTAIGLSEALLGGPGNRVLGEATLYQRLTDPSWVSFHMYSRGALWLAPTLADLRWYSRDPGTYDTLATVRLLERLLERGDDDPPALLTLYWPGLDEWTHKHGTAAQVGYLGSVLEPNLRLLLDGPRPGTGLRDWAGGLDRVTFVLVADHGASTARRWVAPGEVRQVVGSALSSHSGFDELDPQALQEVLHYAPNGGMAHLYLRWPGRSWTDPFPDSAAASALLDTVTAALWQDPLLDAALQLLLVRKADGSGYSVSRGPDEVLLPVEGTLGEDAARAVAWLGGRGGDVLLVGDPDQGAAFLGDDYASSGLYRAVHGGLSPQELGVPVVVAGPGVVAGGFKLPGGVTAVAGLVEQLAVGEVRPELRLRDAPGSPQPPVLLAEPPSVAEVGVPYQWRPSLRDPYGGTTVALEAVLVPAGMVFDAEGVFWTPDLEDLGEHPLVWAAVDERAGRTLFSHAIAVRLPPAREVRAERTPEGVSVSWTGPTGAVAYRIQRVHAGVALQAETPVLEYLDREAPCSSTGYLVHGIDRLGGWSAASSLVLVDALPQENCPMDGN